LGGFRGSFIVPLLYVTSVSPVHNARVCYFNNVWSMFVVFKKNFSFQTTVDPHSASPSHFPLQFFNQSIPPVVHNARVCYFNNVWSMFLVFKKNFSFQTTVDPHSASPSHFPLRFFNPSIPPVASVLRISHSSSLPHRPPLARSFAFLTLIL